MANASSLNAGGRVAIHANGVWYHPVADVEIEPVGIDPDEVVNQDGSVQRVVKPKSYKIKVTIRDQRGLNLTKLVEDGGFDVTATEKDMKRRVHLTNAFVRGSPTRNTATGEISGMEFVSDQFKIVER